MRDNQDPTILRLFAAQDQSLPSDDFMRRMAQRIDERQRLQRLYSVLAIIGCLVLSTLSAPWVAQITSTLIEFTAENISNIGVLLYKPLTWLVVGGLAGCSPVIYLWRTGRW